MFWFFSPGSDFANGFAPGSALRGDMRRRRRNPKFLFAILQLVCTACSTSIQLGLVVLVGPKIFYVEELDHEKEILRTEPHDSEGKGRGSMQS